MQFTTDFDLDHFLFKVAASFFGQKLQNYRFNKVYADTSKTD